MFFKPKEEPLLKKTKYNINEIQNFVIFQNGKHTIRTIVYYNKGKKSCVKIYEFVLEEVKKC